MKKPFAAYKGTDKYVFVCYAHADSDRVYPELTWLNNQGISIWYDEGISAGKIWRTEVGDAISNASTVLFYISSASMSSYHCSREINFALDVNKEILPVYLEDIELTTDLRVGLSSVQALYREDDPRYEENLLSALTNSAIEKHRVREAPSRPPGVWNRIQLAALAIGTALILSLGWVLYEPDDRPVTLLVEKFMTEAGERTGLEFELQRRLSSNPSLIVRVIDSDKEDADYRLIGKISGLTIESILFDRKGEPVASWEIPIEKELSHATNSLSEKILPALGVSGSDFSRFDGKISSKLFQDYLKTILEMRESHSPDVLTEAIRSFEHILSEAPGFAPAYAGICNAYLGLYFDGLSDLHLRLAESHCFRAQNIDEQDMNVHLALGTLFRETGQLEKSLVSFERVLKVAPYHTQAMREKAETLTRLNKQFEARSLLQEAIRVEPSHWENYQALAYLQYTYSDFGGAIENFRIAFSLAPAETAILNNIGAAHFGLGNYEEATVQWQKLAEMTPRAAVFANLGTAYYFQRKLEKAADMYLQAVELAPDNFHYRGELGNVYLLLEREGFEDIFLKAIDLAEGYLLNNRGDEDALSSLASYYAALGERDKALALLGSVKTDQSQEVVVLYQSALAMDRLGSRDEVERILEHLISNGYERKLIRLDSNFDNYSMGLVGSEKP